MSEVTIHIYDTPDLAAAGVGDAFMEGIADFYPKLAGLAAGKTTHPVYEHLVRTEKHSSGWCQTNRLKHQKPGERVFYEAIRERHSVRAAWRVHFARTLGSKYNHHTLQELS